MKKQLSIIILLGCSQVCAIAKADDQSLDDLLGIKKTEKESKKAAANKNIVKPKIKLDDKAKSKLTQKEASQSFDTIVEDMKNVSLQINKKKDTSVTTQRTQKSIVAKLDQLIYSMRPKKTKSKKDKSKKQEQGSEGNQEGTGPKGTKPGDTPPTSESEAGSGSVQDHKAGNIIEQREQWGNLPSRLREELIEGKNEKASPLYRWLAEQYFKALSQEGSKK